MRASCGQKQGGDGDTQGPRHSRAADILFVEDDPLVRRAVFDILSLHGHKVTSAENGEEGLSMFKEGKYDLVFIDLGLPGMSGWKVVEEINRDRPDMPVIVMTGWPEDIIRQALHPPEVQDILSKPFEMGELLDLVWKLTDQGG